jgi:hypothetical protein
VCFNAVESTNKKGSKMVPEPAQSTVSTFAAGLSAGAIALLGVTYYGLLWALIGAVVSLLFAPRQTRGQALAAVIGGMFGGAVISDLVVYVIDGSGKMPQAVHLAVAFVSGAGLKQILSAAIDALVGRIRSFGGNK